MTSIEVKITLPDFVEGPVFSVEAEQPFDVLKQAVKHERFLEGQISDFCTYVRFNLNSNGYTFSFLNAYYHSARSQEVWVKTEREYAVRILLLPEKETLGRRWRVAYYRAWMIISSPEYWQTVKALGESNDLQTFVPEKWMPKYLLKLIEEAKVAQLEIEAWLEENS